MKYYEVIINRTSKPIGRTEETFRQFDNEIKEFVSLEDVKGFLDDEFGQVKTIYKIYRDGKDGEAIEVGKIYAYKNKDWSHDTDSWYQQDWVEVREVNKEIKTILV